MVHERKRGLRAQKKNGMHAKKKIYEKRKK